MCRRELYEKMAKSLILTVVAILITPVVAILITPVVFSVKAISSDEAV